MIPQTQLADPEGTKPLAHKASSGLGGIREAHKIYIGAPSG